MRKSAPFNTISEMQIGKQRAHQGASMYPKDESQYASSKVELPRMSSLEISENYESRAYLHLPERKSLGPSFLSNVFGQRSSLMQSRVSQKVFDRLKSSIAQKDKIALANRKG